MKLIDRQNALARFFTEEDFRNEFVSEKESGKEFLDQIGEIPCRDLADFAESLIGKRLHEVEKMLPLTRKLSGENFALCFRKFAGNFSPQSVKKHLEDALGFAAFLQNEDTDEQIKTAAWYERGRLEFYGGGKSFVCKRFNCSIRRIRENAEENTSGKMQNTRSFLAFAVWLKIAGKIKHINFP